MRAAADRQARKKSIADARTYTLAQLISYSVNDPRKMPKFDKVFPDGKPKPAQSSDEIWALMQAWGDMMQEAEARDG